MMRGGRRDGPFQGRGTLAPVVIGQYLPGGEDAVEDVEEHDGRDAGDPGADRGDHIPAGESVRIVRVAARHAGEAEEMLRKEGQVHAEEEGPEMHLAPEFRVRVAGHLADPEIKSGEDAERSTHREYVMEMGDEEIIVVQFLVEPGIGEHD